MRSYLKIIFIPFLIIFIALDLYADIIPSKERETNINEQIIEYIIDGDVINLSYIHVY